MTFIAIVLIVVFFFIINNRLIAVEALLNDLKKRGGPVQQPSATVVPTPTMAASAPIAQPLTPLVPPVQQPVLIPKPTPAPTPDTSEETWGKTLGVIGVFAVLFGVAFFLKYAFENGIIGITGRLVLGAVVGALGLILGRMLKEKYEAYSYILSGGGIGILFVTTYTAHILYDVISAPLAYILFGIITLISVMLSIKDGKMLMAAIGVSAGFFAPLLISFGGEHFAGLFSYVLIINAGVAFISYVYRWPALHYIAFVGTLLSVSSWFYRIDDESSRLLFVTFITLYFLIFFASSIFHHLVRREMSNGGDIAFITINAIWYVSLAYPILSPVFPDGMGLFMASIGVLYLLLGYFSFATHKEDKILNAALPMMGLFFFTIAIPIQFDGSWITAGWLIEAMCLAVISYKIDGRRLYLYAIVVYVIGLFRLAVLDSTYQGAANEFVSIFNERFLVFVIAIVSGLVMAYFIHRVTKESEEDTEALKPLPLILGVVTQIITLVLFTSETHYYYSTQEISGAALYNADSRENTFVSIVWALYAAFLTVLGFVMHSKVFRVFGAVLFFLTAFRIFIGIWALGPIYRIVTFIIFGVIALLASFLYARFKEKITHVS
jgi:uncharacterized membrane protein